MYDVSNIRKDFPIFSVKINGQKNTYLDTAASAQKPQCVIDKMCDIYKKAYANVHRGDYALSQSATSEFENARRILQNFIGAKDVREIVFTRNATESINLVAASWGLKNLKAGDEILISEAEHHANLIPWQMVAEKTGATLKIFKLKDNGDFVPEEFEKCLSGRVKLVGMTGMSNVLGTIYPIKEIISAAHKKGAVVLIDACQLAAHKRIDVQDLDCDFLAFSGHKLYGPTGIGVLYGKMEILEGMPPYQTGGDMVDRVTYQKTTFAAPPARFEAGTPAFVEAAGLASAVEYVSKLGFENIEKHEQNLVAYFSAQTKHTKGFKLLSQSGNQGGIFAFELNGVHPQDLAFVLAHEGVSIRVGHHCAEPFVNRLGYASIARASIGLYSSIEDIDAFFKAIEKVRRFF